MKDDGQIEIGLSYHVVFELLQKATPEFRDDRLARARFLTQLCGQNAFPYPTDLGAGYGFSTEGLWVPRIDLEDIEIEHLIEHTIETMARRSDLTRHDRKVLSKRSYIVECGRSNPTEFMRLAKDRWPLPFGREFIENGDFTLYMLGDLSRDEANKALRFYITDPVTVYEVWFEYYGRDNPVRDRRDKMAEKLVEMLKGFEAALDEQAALKAKIDEALGASGDNALSPEGRCAHRSIASTCSD